MGTILMAWELGSGLGHIRGLLPLAIELRARGHRPLMALKELAHAEALLSPHGIPFLQAPLWLAPSSGPAISISYAEILQGFGFLEPNKLTGIVRAWRMLAEATQAELVISDHAPTALLAAAGMGLPRVRFGMGFTVPPRATPVPGYLPATAESDIRIRQSEAQTLDGIKKVQRALGMPEFTRFEDLLSSEADFLQTVPELDHYQNRGEANYLGIFTNTDEGIPPIWPASSGKRIFVYLNPSWPESLKLLRILKTLRHAAIIFAPGLDARTRAQFVASHLTFSDTIINIEQARQEADIAICNGNYGTTTAFLLAGKPVLCLPLQMEQYVFSQRIESIGAGISIDSRSKNKNYALAIQRLLNEPSFSACAQRFADKYNTISHRLQVAKMADMIEALLQGKHAGNSQSL